MPIAPFLHPKALPLEKVRFRLTERYFLPLQKVPKNRPGVGRGRTSSAKGALSF